MEKMSKEKTDMPQWKDFIYASVMGVLTVSQIILYFLFYNRAGPEVLLYVGEPHGIQVRVN